MYVDVVACRRGRVKVDVNLVKNSKRKAAPAIVALPVRVSMPDEDIYDEPAELYTESADVQTLELSEEEPVIVDEAATPEELEMMAAEAITAIDEMLSDTENTDAIGNIDDMDAVVSDALDELDNMNRRTADMIERLDDELEEALDEINDSADENSEQLSSTISECLETVDNAIAQREAERIAEQEEPADEAQEAEEKTEVSAPEAPEEKSEGNNAYMRYFSRDEQGEKVEVDNEADGIQEVVCYDGVSGKVSRVCGIIKKETETRPAVIKAAEEKADMTAPEESGVDKEAE